MIQNEHNDNLNKSLKSISSDGTIKSSSPNVEGIELSELVKKLPRGKEFIPLYINILKSTDTLYVRDEMAYMLSCLCPQNDNLKNILIDLINSPKTENHRGSLIYALENMDYSDNNCITMLCEQIVSGNWECRHLSFNMLAKIIPQLNSEKVDFLRNLLYEQGQVMAERIDMLDDLYNIISQ